MGYAGYAPGKYAPPKPTEVQAALRQVARQDSYELLSKLLRNVVRPRIWGGLMVPSLTACRRIIAFCLARPLRRQAALFRDGARGSPCTVSEAQHVSSALSLSLEQAMDVSWVPPERCLARSWRQFLETRQPLWQVVNPSDDKYRRLRLSNPKIAATIVDVPGALDALLAMGWERDANDADFLVCPKGVRVTMAEVRPRASKLCPSILV